LNLLPVDENAHETKEFQPAVVKLLTDNDWLVYHTYDSRKSKEGFPDLLAIKGAYLLVSELKSFKGKTTEAQDKWLSAFEKVRTITVRLWKPGIHNDEIIEIATTRGKDNPVDEVDELRLKMLSTCEHKMVTWKCQTCMKVIVDGLGSVVKE